MMATDFVGGLPSCHGSVHGMGIVKCFLGKPLGHSFTRDFLWSMARTAQRLIRMLKKRTLGETKNLEMAMRHTVRN
jgi:hypothetical protein